MDNTRRIDDDGTLTYVVQSETWYASVIDGPAAMSVVADADGGGCKWEFAVEQHHLGGRDVLRLQMFGDAFEAFSDIPEFFDALRVQAPSTLQELQALLDGIGARDATERERALRA